MESVRNQLDLGELVLESGQRLPLRVVYHSRGRYVPGRSKVVWVCHALTANSDVADWWSGLFGDQKLFDRPGLFVVCANIIGSCYGSSGPVSGELPEALRGLSFPAITTRDMAQAHERLREALGIHTIDLLLGASLGGQQALEWAYVLGEKLRQLILMATNAFHSPFGIAFNESQRMALEADPTFFTDDPAAGRKGLMAARSIAILSYRSYAGYRLTQSEPDADRKGVYRAASYQRYQGEKLANRFHAHSYRVLLDAMDSHHIGRGRVSVEMALQRMTADCLVVGISSDLLFPVAEQQFLVQWLPRARFAMIHSDFGHDGFLVETEQLAAIFSDFLDVEKYGAYESTTDESQ